MESPPRAWRTRCPVYFYFFSVFFFVFVFFLFFGKGEGGEGNPYASRRASIDCLIVYGRNLFSRSRPDG